MKRATAVLALLILASCASANRSALENAKLAYADTSLAYETGMQTISDLRAQHQVTDAQWIEVDKAQKLVQALAPSFRSALSLWESSGSKPYSYDGLEKQIADAVANIAKILAKVKK